jgi:hypothetical protein
LELELVVPWGVCPHDTVNGINTSGSKRSPRLSTAMSFENEDNLSDRFIDVSPMLFSLP